MVLSRNEILSRLREFSVDSPQSLVITPLIHEKITDIFDADSVDLRLGSHFLLPKNIRSAVFLA